MTKSYHWRENRKKLYDFKQLANIRLKNRKIDFQFSGL